MDWANGADHDLTELQRKLRDHDRQRPTFGGMSNLLTTNADYSKPALEGEIARIKADTEPALAPEVEVVPPFYHEVVAAMDATLMATAVSMGEPHIVTD